MDNDMQEFKGYVFKIKGGCDKQGFPMKQGVLTPGRVRLLLHRDHEEQYFPWGHKRSLINLQYAQTRIEYQKIRTQKKFNQFACKNSSRSISFIFLINC
uniref:Uncharacterized protein n=1 Tax=Gossypium raimondii TaxID=29730 RepID=A0A0D2RQA6_GOSRA|nr:hypothetical protein B456_005G207700 [Gossypium raimondii]